MRPLRGDVLPADGTPPVVPTIQPVNRGVDVVEAGFDVASIAATWARSNAIVAPSGSCSSSAFDDSDASTTPWKSRGERRCGR